MSYYISLTFFYFFQYIMHGSNHSSPHIGHLWMTPDWEIGEERFEEQQSLLREWMLSDESIQFSRLPTISESNELIQVPERVVSRRVEVATKNSVRHQRLSAV